MLSMMLHLLKQNLILKSAKDDFAFWIQELRSAWFAALTAGSTAHDVGPYAVSRESPQARKSGYRPFRHRKMPPSEGRGVARKAIATKPSKSLRMRARLDARPSRRQSSAMRDLMIRSDNARFPRTCAERPAIDAGMAFASGNLGAVVPRQPCRANHLSARCVNETFANSSTLIGQIDIQKQVARPGRTAWPP